MKIQFVGLPTDRVRAAKATGLDAYGLPFERAVSDGGAWPCRHCLGETPIGEEYLALAWRPFEGLNAYTETGPLFLCAEDCAPATPSERPPKILRSPQYLVRGYTADERILYGTGHVVETPNIARYAQELLENPEIAFVDVRSAANNCYQCRIERA
ncbi:DUF1203 domain-containing protein [Roseovarius sp. EL26]|uniref:DUF1203 domain-containing protein n=1 Tax=Roseovarius sp. EL26 TaxID=2126672 RepID=UPI000EA21B20|nr:DUF1203 domain-containing protein [Roseovarius sp. EL26]